MISIIFQRGDFTREFSLTVNKVKNPIGLLKVVGRELGNQLKAWFLQRDQNDPNELSPRRSHFWLAVSRTLGEPMIDGLSVSVTINDPRFAQKVFGGLIKAKAAGALTIPVEERAYDRTAATFEHETGLKLILIHTGKGAFQNAILAVKEGKGLTVEYILTKNVNQERDPNALPVASLLEQAITARAQSYFNNEAILA